MTPLKAFVVDDERPAVRRMTLLLSEQPGVELVGSSSDAIAAVAAIVEARPHLLFVDIAMPGLDGFGVVERLPPGSVSAVIFTTAHGQHALRAFDANAVDYLLKPVEAPRLAAALAKARAIVEARSGDRGLATLRDVLPELRADVRDAEAPRPYPAQFWIYKHREVVRVAVDDIHWAEAEGDYVRFHADGGGGLLRRTLSDVEAELDPAIFVRVHRSAIVRRADVIALRRKPSGALAAKLADGTLVPVGRSFGKSLRGMLELMGRH